MANDNITPVSVFFTLLLLCVFVCLWSICLSKGHFCWFTGWSILKILRLIILHIFHIVWRIRMLIYSFGVNHSPWHYVEHIYINLCCFSTQNIKNIIWDLFSWENPQKMEKSPLAISFFYIYTLLKFLYTFNYSLIPSLGCSTFFVLL